MLLKLRSPEKSVSLFPSRVQLCLFTWAVYAPVPQKAEAGPQILSGRCSRRDRLTKTNTATNWALVFLINLEMLHFLLQWLKSVCFKHCFRFVADGCFGVEWSRSWTPLRKLIVRCCFLALVCRPWLWSCHWLFGLALLFFCSQGWLQQIPDLELGQVLILYRPCLYNSCHPSGMNPGLAALKALAAATGAKDVTPLAGSTSTFIAFRTNAGGDLWHTKKWVMPT